jgi:hypothetical protein
VQTVSDRTAVTMLARNETPDLILFELNSCFDRRVLDGLVRKGQRNPAHFVLGKPNLSKPIPLRRWAVYCQGSALQLLHAPLQLASLGNPLLE